MLHKYVGFWSDKCVVEVVLALLHSRQTYVVERDVPSMTDHECRALVCCSKETHLQISDRFALLQSCGRREDLQTWGLQAPLLMDR